MKKIFIFGAGKYGKTLFYFLKNIRVDVCGFLQSNLGMGKTCEGLPVYFLRDFPYASKEAYVLLAVADDAVRIMAKTILITKGMGEERIFDCSRFIEDNCLTEELEGCGEHYCILCGKKIEEFLPSGVEAELFRSHRIVGGGVREHAACPNCGCIDRHRWCMFVLMRDTSLLNRSCTVLHLPRRMGLHDLLVQIRSAGIIRPI